MKDKQRPADMTDQEFTQWLLKETGPKGEEQEDIPAWSSLGKVIELPEQPHILLSGKAGHIINSLMRDEPVFILRAKDILSTMALMHYVGLVETYQPHHEQLQELTELLNEFRTWQQENRTEVRLPD